MTGEPAAVPTATPAPNGRADWTAIVTLVGATVLIATQTIAASVAAGWAIAGFFGLGDIGAYVLEAIGLGAGVWIVTAFVRKALKHAPLRKA
jgi:hypothetical protein